MKGQGRAVHPNREPLYRLANVVHMSRDMASPRTWHPMPPTSGTTTPSEELEHADLQSPAARRMAELYLKPEDVASRLRQTRVSPVGVAAGAVNRAQEN